MKGLEFPIIGTKMPGASGTKYDINSPAGRKVYFEAKAGPEIASIKRYLKDRSFIAYLLGKKNSGKGTYSKLFTEIFGTENIAHVSVGDVVRDIHANWEEFSKSERYSELKRLYRGFISFEDAVAALTGRSTSTLLPTEFVLALMKLHIAELEGKTVFVDGLPRELDQVSYSLYFRDLINYRQDPDVFVLIDIPENVIAERITNRVICPKCNTSRSIKLLVSSKIAFDTDKNEFYLICDNPDCTGKERMVAKEGDELGLEPIRGRLDKDEDILRKAFAIHGVPKVLLRNHVPVADADKYFDKYELTPEFVLSYDDKKKKVQVDEKPWTVKDDNGVESFSLMAAPVVVTMIKQLADVLEV